MAQVKPGQPFGLDSDTLGRIDWTLALNRILQDLRSDFIHAPHLAFIYAKAGPQLLAIVKKALANGTYSPGLPMHIEVPKTSRIQMTKSKRLGPSYSRLGSILMPKDRVVYQALADEAAAIIDSKTDHKRSFSHRLVGGDSPSMFVPTRTCWNALQKANAAYSKKPNSKYILRLDISNFFGSINQHTLVNVLRDVKYPETLVSRLEALLSGYTGARSSRGILQGMYPSDLFGNFYMAPIDRLLKESEVLSARYVDDLYIFVESVNAADKLLRKLIAELRNYDLVLNESKSKLMPASALITEEPDLDELFDAAVDEVSDQLDDEEFDADYGFQTDWEDDESVNGSELALAATKVLFDAINEYPGYVENIERFCLPLFARSRSDYAISHVLDAFYKRPAMAQIYSAYLANFLDEHEVEEFLSESLEDDRLTDWQQMWTLAALSKSKPSNENSVKRALDLIQDGKKHDALRAVAAIYVGTYGDHARRRSLSAVYQSASSYIQVAIYYSSRQWPRAERSTARTSWGSHGELGQLMSNALEAGSNK